MHERRLFRKGTFTWLLILEDLKCPTIATRSIQVSRVSVEWCTEVRGDAEGVCVVTLYVTANASAARGIVEHREEHG